MNVGENLRKIRLERKLTQKTLAKTLGVTRVTLSKWENGKSRPSSEILFEYQKLFELEKNHFNKDEEEILTFDVSQMSLSGRLELCYFYESLIKKEEYLKKP